MRDKPTKRKTEGHDLTRRLVFDDIKYKITQGMKAQHSRIDKQSQGENNQDRTQRHLYQICSKGNSIGGLDSQKICESIVVEEESNISEKQYLSKKRNSLGIDKCFDVQVKKETGNRQQIQAYLKILQQENQELKGEVQKLNNQITDLSKEQENNVTIKQKIQDIEIRLLQASIKDNQSETLISKYHRYFQEGKDTMLKMSLALIEAKDLLGVSISPKKLRDQQSQLGNCLQKTEKMISYYSHLVEKSKNNVHEDVILQQLTSVVKCQQKTIEKLRDSRKNDDGNFYHQNKLLRYQVNRLSAQNQQLNTLLSHSRSRSIQELRESRHKEVGIKLQSFCQTEEELVPVVEIKETMESPMGLMETKEGTSRQDTERYNHKERYINNLLIEKQFLSDQVEAAQKSLQNVNREFIALNQEKTKLLKTLEKEKLRNETLEEELSINQAQKEGVAQQVDLLRDKVRRLEGSSLCASRYVELQSNNSNVTVETLLKFMKKKELVKYHQALMELINRYQSKISELNSCFMDQRQMKDRFMKYSQKLYNMVLSSSPLTLEELVLAISTYQEEIKHVRENDIDILLRKVKSFSIGVDYNQLENIKAELEEYVYQLRTRLPSLSEEYFEDGSSVGDSYNASIQHFQS